MESRTRPIAAPSGGTRSNSRRREIESSDLTWLDLPQPAAGDAAYLRDRFRLDPLLLDDLLSSIQRPKLDAHPADQYLFLVVHVPVLDRDNRVALSEVFVIAGREYLVTAHDGNLKPLRRLFAAASSDEAARAQLMGRGSGYLLYRILDTLVKQSFPVVYRFDEEIEKLDARMLAQPDRALAQECALIQRDTITLQHLIRPNLAVCDDLCEGEWPFLRLDTARYFGDYADGMYKLHDLAAEQRDAATALCASLGALVGLQQARSLRTLAALAVALVALALLAAVAALALVAPPLAQPIVFAVALVATFAAAGGALALARARGWL